MKLLRNKKLILVAIASLLIATIVPCRAKADTVQTEYVFLNCTTSATSSWKYAYWGNANIYSRSLSSLIDDILNGKKSSPVTIIQVFSNDNADTDMQTMLDSLGSAAQHISLEEYFSLTGLTGFGGLNINGMPNPTVTPIPTSSPTPTPEPTEEPTPTPDSGSSGSGEEGDTDATPSPTPTTVPAPTDVPSPDENEDPDPLPTMTPNVDYSTLPTFDQLTLLNDIAYSIDSTLCGLEYYNSEIANRLGSLANYDQMNALLENTSDMTVAVVQELQAVQEDNKTLSEKVDYLTVHVVFIAGFIACSWMYKWVKRIYERPRQERSSK